MNLRIERSLKAAKVFLPTKTGVSILLMTTLAFANADAQQYLRFFAAFAVLLSDLNFAAPCRSTGN
jgi:hypothetical protein